MSASGSRALAGLLAAAAVLAATGCGSDTSALRVGVLTECGGLFSQTRTATLAGAELPLVERGASPGTTPEDFDGATVAGVRIEIVPGCTQVQQLSGLIAETRRLVESEDVDVVVGPLGTPEGTVIPDLAAKYPEVTFFHGAGLAQEATLRMARPNAFRLTTDGPQGVAGLGRYAFDDLGWRRAAVVAEGYPGGWELAAGFVAEFCALGGTVVERDFTSLLAPGHGGAATRHAASADGVVVLSTVVPAAIYLQEFAAAAGPDLGRRVLLSGSAFFTDPANLAPPNLDLTGVVVGGPVRLDGDDAALKAYRESFERTYPSLPPGAALFDVTLSAHAAMEAVLQALEATGGDLGEGQQVLRRALSETTFDLPEGPVRLDGNGQAVSRITLMRVAAKDGALTRVRTIDGVDEAFGGLFTTESPSPSVVEPRCRRGTPPPWAR